MPTHPPRRHFITGNQIDYKNNHDILNLNIDERKLISIKKFLQHSLYN